MNFSLAGFYFFFAVGPMLAPLVGAFILQFFTWRATFWALVAVCGASLLVSFALQETLSQEERNEGGSGYHFFGKGAEQIIMRPSVV